MSLKIVKFVENMEIMKVVEKRDFIHSHLHQIDENFINEMYEKMQSIINKESVLKSKLSSRAKKAEEDILTGKVFSRGEIEERTNKIAG